MNAPASIRFSAAPHRMNLEVFPKTRHYHVMDTTVMVIASVALATAVTQILTPEATADRIMILMSFMGAVVTMGGAIMLNPEVETRKITIGRGLFGILFGAGGPWALSALLRYWTMDGLQTLLLHPGMLLFEGTAFSFTAFWLSKPFCKQAYERAGHIAKAKMRQIERMGGVEDESKRDP